MATNRKVTVTADTQPISPNGVFTCLRCGWQWRGRDLDCKPPVCCANKECHSAYWRTHRAEKVAKEVETPKGADIIADIEPVIPIVDLQTDVNVECVVSGIPEAYSITKII